MKRRQLEEKAAREEVAANARPLLSPRFPCCDSMGKPGLTGLAFHGISQWMMATSTITKTSRSPLLPLSIFLPHLLQAPRGPGCARSLPLRWGLSFIFPSLPAGACHPLKPTGPALQVTHLHVVRIYFCFSKLIIRPTLQNCSSIHG